MSTSSVANNNPDILPYDDVDLSNVSSSTSMDHLRSQHGHHHGHHQQTPYTPNTSMNSNSNSNSNSNMMDKTKQRRNTWNEKKNAILVDVVKNCKYPTPWRPKHGTNKEIWQDIANQMMLRSDVFDTQVHWESAKDQLLKLIDRQRLRRSLGDYSVKTETELYIDEMIKHVTADDEERLSAMKKQKDRSKRGFRRMDDLDGSGEYDDDELDDDANPEKRLKITEAVGDMLSHRLIAELQNCKQMTKAGSDLLSSTQIDSSDALMLVQQQLSSCQAVLTTAQALLLRIVNGENSTSPQTPAQTPSLSVSK
jgi:hypothetical protein